MTTRRIDVRASLSGRVRLVAPSALTGELEIFDEGEAVAVVENGEREAVLRAPVAGFVHRIAAADGDEVAEGSVVMVLTQV